MRQRKSARAASVFSQCKTALGQRFNLSLAILLIEADLLLNEMSTP
jgi:hypothetical protein